MQGFIALAEESLHRAQAFLHTHATELADVNVAAPRAELDDAVRQLSAHAADQEATRTNVRGDTRKKQSLYDAVVDLCARLNKETPWLDKATEKRNP